MNKYFVLVALCSASCYSMNELDKFDLSIFSSLEQEIFSEAAQLDTPLIMIGRLTQEKVFTVSRVNDHQYRICYYRTQPGKHRKRLTKLQFISPEKFKDHLEAMPTSVIAHILPSGTPLFDSDGHVHRSQGRDAARKMIGLPGLAHHENDDT